MSLSDCPECWNTPCDCGHEYISWNDERILRQIEMLREVLVKRGSLRIGLGFQSERMHIACDRAMATLQNMSYDELLKGVAPKDD